MTQEQILYDVRLTQSPSKPILIVEGYMDDKDRQFSVEETDQKAQAEAGREVHRTVEDVVASFAKQLEQKPDIADWSDRELRKMLHQLQSVPANGDVEKQKELQQHQQLLLVHMQERGLAQREASFDEELAEKWVEAVGDEVTIKRGDEAAEVSLKTVGGRDVLILPAKLTLADVIQAAQLLGHVEGTDIKTATAEKMQSFAKQLKDATFFLARQENDGKPVFDDGVLTYLYDYAEQLRSLAAGEEDEEDVDKKTADEIRKDAKHKDLLPEYFEKNPEAIQHHGGKEKVQEDYENRLFLSLLGKNHATAQVRDGEVGSFYDRVRERYRRREQGKKSPESFEEWLIKRKKFLLSNFAAYVNNGRIYANENTQRGLSEETQTRAEQSVFEAISQRGKAKQKELQIKALDGNPEMQQQVRDILQLEPDEAKVADLFVKAQEIKKNRLTLSEQFTQINRLVLQAYGLEYVQENGNYFPAKALAEGEFGCSVQTMLMADLLQEVYGDELVLLADTTIAGNAEEELSGHIRLVAITKESLHTANPEAFFIDTHTDLGGLEGPTRMTVVDKITDNSFAMEAAKAYLLSPDDVHTSLRLDNEETDGMASYEKNHTLTSVQTGVESAIWNNMAATLEPKEGQSTREFEEEKIRRVEMALALNPANAIAWAQLASLNAEDITRHNAFLQKAQALNETIEAENVKKFTIDVYAFQPQDPHLKDLVGDINNALRTLPQDPTLPSPDIEMLDFQTLRDIIANVRAYKDAPLNSSNQQLQAEAKTMLDTLQEAFNTSYNREKRRADLLPKFSTLSDEDVRILEEHPMDWLNAQFDNLYTLLEPGQELSSPQLNTLESLFGNAAQFVANKSGSINPDEVKRFSKEHNLRLNALVMRTHINNRDFQQIGPSARNLGIGGLFEGLGLDNGRVEQMYNRLSIALDTQRLARGGAEHRLRPEIAVRIPEEIIDEEFTLAARGTGSFAAIRQDIEKAIDDPSHLHHVRYHNLVLEQASVIAKEKWYKIHPGVEIPDDKRAEFMQEAKQSILDKATRQTITRSVRFAYDLLICSQRDAVIASRGSVDINDIERFRSDPTGINAYNLETFLISKFGLLNYEEQEFFDDIKVELARNELRYNKKKSPSEIGAMSKHELEAIGTELFKDLFAVPDLYSSGWRMDAIAKGLNARLGEERAQNLALFMRLRQGNDDQRREIWNKIGIYYPEEIARIIREKRANNPEFVGCFNNDLFTPKDRNGNQLPDKADGIEKVQFRYDNFRERFDPVIRYLREENLNKYITGGTDQLLDLTHLSQEQIEAVDNALYAGAAEELQAMYAQLQSTLNTKDMRNMLVSDVRFKDIYTRVMRVDDIPLALLQDTKGNHASISSELASQPGNDALVRAWGDTNIAQEAAQKLVAFLKGGPMGDKGLDGKIHTAEEFAEKVGAYNGVDAAAEMVRSTAGSLLLMAEEKPILDYLGINHLPFNLPVSRTQEIFGPGAKSLTRGEIQEMMFHLQERLMKAGHSEEQAHEIVNQLKERLGVTRADMVKMQIVALFILLLLAAASISIDVVDLKGMTSGK